MQTLAAEIDFEAKEWVKSALKTGESLTKDELELYTKRMLREGFLLARRRFKNRLDDFDNDLSKINFRL